MGRLLKYVPNTILQMHNKFGKTWGRYSGITPTIVTIDPDIIKEVMVKQVYLYQI